MSLRHIIMFDEAWYIFFIVHQIQGSDWYEIIDNIIVGPLIVNTWGVHAVYVMTLHDSIICNYHDKHGACIQLWITDWWLLNLIFFNMRVIALLF